jgi:rod shape-determining protein MreD
MTFGLQSSFMLPLLAIASILQATVLNRFTVASVKPDLVLLIILVWTLIHGGASGVVWAFVGGIWLDIFSGGPMGASSLGLMAAALIASIGYRTLYRYNLLVPLFAVVFGTLAFSFIYLGILYGLTLLDLGAAALPLRSTVENVVVPSMLYNTTLMICLVPWLNRLPQPQRQD